MWVSLLPLPAQHGCDLEQHAALTLKRSSLLGLTSQTCPLEVQPVLGGEGAVATVNPAVVGLFMPGVLLKLNLLVFSLSSANPPPHHHQLGGGGWVWVSLNIWGGGSLCLTLPAGFVCLE